MKGYYIEITNNLLDPKHQKKMKESVWLFMWCLDKMTSITEEGIGKVLGGKPIKHKEVKEDLGISRATYKRWIKMLKEGGYINLKRTPYGLIISVNKAKKRWGRKVRDDSKMSHLKCKNEPSNKTVYSKTYTSNKNFKELRNAKNTLKEKMNWKL